MKAVKLTPKEKEVFEDLKSTPGGVLFQHIRPTGTVCFRLLDVKKNPIKNIRYGLVMKLIEKDVIERKGSEYTLKATSETDYSKVGLSAKYE